MGTPDLNLLPLFVAVAETWSMSAAARKLGIPKSSVSRGSRRSRRRSACSSSTAARARWR
ncbi:helix-turn-helix domain-containing protein [Cystobacter fuscus]